MRIAINAVSATSGGGLSVAVGLTQAMVRGFPDDEYHVFVRSEEVSLIFDSAPNLKVTSLGLLGATALSRGAWEQTGLARRSSSFDVVLGLSGFSPRWTSTPQVVVAQNALYFTADASTTPRRRAKALFQLAAFKSAMRSGATCVAVSRYVAQLLRSRDLVPEDRLFVIPNAPFVESPEPHDDWSSGERFSVLWVGSMSEHKNIDGFLAAVPSLLADPVVKTIGIAGRSSAPEEHPDHSSLEVVSWLGVLKPKRLQNTIAHSDVVVLTSGLEASPLVPLEATRLGTAVVASDIAPHREILGPGSLYPLGDTDSLVSRILQLLRNPELSKEVVEGNREITDGFTWTTRAAQYHEVLEQSAKIH